MSLLDRACREPIIVYPEVEDVDADGNKRRKPSTTGVVAKARFQVQGQSGTSSRRQEQDSEGFESEKVFNMRLHSSWTGGVLGMQSQIDWNGDRYVIFGPVNPYSGGSRTRHIDYTVKRF